MSIQSEITRISGNVSDALSAIQAKGVTIPSGANSDDLADLIAQISGGGGITVVETQDPNGGTIVTITGEELRLQSKSATPTTSQQTIAPDNGYTGLSQVTVGAIPSEYVIPTGTKTINQNGTGIDVAAYANVDVAVPAPTPNLQAKTNIAPTESSQTIQADSGYDGLSSVQINAISSTYVGSNVPRKSAEYYHPSTTDQTIASNRYLTGAQTIMGVTTTNLVASNILSGVTVKVGDSSDDDCVASVSGSVVIQHYYTGSAAPSSSLGVNGDIYLQTS